MKVIFFFVIVIVDLVVDSKSRSNFIVKKVVTINIFIRDNPEDLEKIEQEVLYLVVIVTINEPDVIEIVQNVGSSVNV